MSDDLSTYRLRIGLHYHRHLKVKGLKFLSTFELLIVLSLVLIRCGDVELNPGPELDSDSSSSTASAFSDLELKNKFSVVHYNVQSILNKVDIIQSELQQFDVISLTETWLDNSISDDEIIFNGFNLFRRDRVNDRHGGVCVFVKRELYAKRRIDLELQNTECIWVEIFVDHKKLLIGTFYRSPNSSNDALIAIENSIGLANDTNIHDILITGDFNLDIFKPNTWSKINNLCQYFGLEQLIKEPTHYTESSSSAIDLFLTSNSNNVFLTGVGDPFLEHNIRYHCPIFCLLKFDNSAKSTFSRHIWLYDRCDFNSFRDEIQQTDWQLFKHDNIDTYAENVTTCLTELAKKHVPNKTIICRPLDPPWLTTYIRKLIRKRKRLFSKFKKSKNANDFDNYKTFRNIVTNEIRKSKKEQIDKLTENINNNTNCSKDWWKTLKAFIKPNQTSSIPPLNVNGDIYSDNTDKATILNDYFTEQSSLDDSNANLPADLNIPDFTLNSISITANEVESVLKALQTGKASGPDAINNRILKELAKPLSFPLSDLFNASLSKGKVPALWKQANVTPIHKKNDPSEITNYRPISLLSTVGKVLEKIVHKYVFNFLMDHEVLTTLQSGFISGDSTVNQLVDIYNSFCKALDEGKEVRAIFCDISKAFDRVWIKGLLYKLQTVGITGHLLQWFTDYLNNRKQRVVLPGDFSHWANLKAGVPQGSILGPLLFLIYINDIVRNINSSIRLFADDTSLYIIVENPIQAATILNSDLSQIYTWASNWLVTFNPSKTESLLFSRKLFKPLHPTLYMNQQDIITVESHKHLGLTFTNDLSWHEHLNNIKTKAWHRINVMRKLKFQLSRKSLQIIYFSFIKPLLEYADVVWDNCTQYEANELEKIQHEAARIVSGATKLVSIDKLLKEVGWDTLSCRRKKHKQILFYKMINGLCPDYLSSLVPPTVGNSTVMHLITNTYAQILSCITIPFFPQ